MSDMRDPDAIISAWLDEGPTRLPESNRRSITTTTRTITQRRRGFGPPWRFPAMNGYFRLALTGAAVVVAALGGLYLLDPGGSPGTFGGPRPTPSTSASPISTQTPIPSPTPAPATVGTVTISEASCAFERGPDPLVAGASWILTDNASDYRAGFDVWRMRDGHTFDELSAWIAEEQRRLAAGLPVVGYPYQIADGPWKREQDPGGTGVLAMTLARGTYGIVCYKDTDDDRWAGAIYLTGPLEVE